VCHNLQLENVSDQCRSSIISEALEDSIWNPKVNNPATSSLFTIKFDCVFCSKCLGCVYVQREYKSSDHKGVSGVVTERLQAAHSDPKAPGLLLFPEGTTTNGSYILPFKTGAFLARTPVQPMLLKYPFKRFSPAWDTIGGARHVILLLCQYVNHLEVVRLPVYRPTEKECADPKLYANNVRTLMAAEGNLTMSDIGLYEKRVFHNALLGKPAPVAPAPQGKCTIVYGEYYECLADTLSHFVF
jgi:hypothetical protein